MNSDEFKRWLAKQGATFGAQKGSHLKVYLNGKQSVLPIHAAELKADTVEDIKKQLGIKRGTKMRFPVTLTPDKEADGFVVTFPDIPEAITQGETEDEALAMAREALELVLEFYFDDKRAVPAPSQPAPGQHVVELPASLASKMLLLNEMVRQGVRPSELARRLHTRPQDVNRLTDLGHTTRIDSIDAALHALGKRLEMSVA